MQPNAGGRFSLRSSLDQAYLSTPDAGAGALVAGHSSVGGWEQFTFKVFS